MKVDGSLKSLLQGVSQQPIRDRLAGQCTEQLNMTSDPVSGLSRRPPTDIVAAINYTDNHRLFYNFETRDGDKFLLQVNDGIVSVKDFEGNAFPVTQDADATAYITAPGTLVCGTVENQVVVVNRSVVAAMKPEFKTFANAGPGGKPMGLIQVRGGQYNKDYRVYFNGTLVAMYRPPNGATASDIGYIRTTWIASRLFEALTVAAPDSQPDGPTSYMFSSGAFAAPAFSMIRQDDILYVRRNLDNTPFTLTVSDDANTVNFKAMTDQVGDNADLPRYAPQGYLARIATETDPDNDLFLEFKLNAPYDTYPYGSGFGLKGYWQETISSDVTYLMDKATLPHVLEWDPNTQSFRFRRGAWKDRQVGTDGSNPEPSFIGNYINDIATFQSRLVFLSSSYVCMSRTNRFEDFWMSSASQLLDSDPIDVSSTAVEASTMLAVVPHNRDLTIWSSKGQFVVFGRNALTPANATLVLTTAFEAELSAKPQPAGRNVFFGTNYGAYTGIREFYTEGSTDINDTRPITQHIKRYIPGKVNKLSSSSNYDTLLVKTTLSDKDVYVYQYIWNDQEKIQSSWSKWSFQHEVVFHFFDEELVYFVLREGLYYYLYRMSLDVQDGDGVGYPIYLDARFDVISLYKSFVVPFDWMADEENLILVQGLNCPNPGQTVPIESMIYDDINNHWVCTVKYDCEGGDVIGGWNFESMYRPTMPLVKDKDNVVIATGKLRVKHFILSLDQTGDINGQMLSSYANGEVVKFQGRILGDVFNVVGVTALSDEKFVMPFREQTDRADFKVFTKSHLPMTILDIEWVGQYSKRGRRIDGGGS